MTPDDLDEAVRLHGLWVQGEPAGTRADLSGANLAGARLRGATLRGAILTNAYLRGASLTDAILRGADLRGAALSGADLRGADLAGADLSGADLRGASLPDGWWIDQSGAWGPRRRTQTVRLHVTDGGPDWWVQQGCIAGTPDEFLDEFEERREDWRLQTGFDDAEWRACHEQMHRSMRHLARRAGIEAPR